MDIHSKKIHENVLELLNCGLLSEAKADLIKAASLGNQWAEDALIAFSIKDQSLTSIDISIPFIKAGSKVALNGVHGGRYNYIRVFTKMDGNNEGDSLFVPIKPIVVPAKPPMSCFVLTVCFDSEDAPTVNSFRNYRDNRLSSHAFGRAFIRWYYRYGPRLAEFLGIAISCG